MTPTASWPIRVGYWMGIWPTLPLPMIFISVLEHSPQAVIRTRHWYGSVMRVRSTSTTRTEPSPIAATAFMVSMVFPFPFYALSCSVRSMISLCRR